MSAAQRGLVALVGLLLLVALAATKCGPDDAAPGVTETSVTMDEPDESRAQASQVPSGGSGGTTARDRESTSMVWVRVSDTSGAPVVGARAVLLRADGSSGGPIAEASVSNGGRARLEGIPDGRHHLMVSAGGYLNSDAVPLRFPDESGGEVIVQLSRAGRIDGALYAVDGKPYLEGLLRLRATSGGERLFHVRPDERGSFESGPLEPGVWELAWLPGQGDQPDPRMVTLRAIGAGERVTMEITVDVPGRVAAEGRRVGIAER